MKFASFFAVLLFALTGCVTDYDCGLQAGGDVMAMQACRQTKGTLVYRYCVDNHRYKDFAECGKDATKDGAEHCLARKAPRPLVYECLTGKGPALVTVADQAKAKPLPTLKLEQDPKPASKGNGPFVTGIVLTAVGPALGLMAYSYGKALNCDKEDKEDDRKTCKEAKDNAPTAGAIYAGLGLGIGLPLLFDGLDKRRAYKEWQARHPESTATRLNLVPLGHGGLAASLTFNID